MKLSHHGEKKSLQSLVAFIYNCSSCWNVENEISVAVQTKFIVKMHKMIM